MHEQTELSDIAVEQIEAVNAEIALEDEVKSLRTKLAYMAADFDKLSHTKITSLQGVI